MDTPLNESLQHSAEVTSAHSSASGRVPSTENMAYHQGFKDGQSQATKLAGDEYRRNLFDSCYDKLGRINSASVFVNNTRARNLLESCGTCRQSINTKAGRQEALATVNELCTLQKVEGSVGKVKTVQVDSTLDELKSVLTLPNITHNDVSHSRFADNARMDTKDHQTVYNLSERDAKIRHDEHLAHIAVNLTDPQFTGQYHGRRKHASDLDAVVARAAERGVEKILITGTSLAESREAFEMAKKYGLHCTAGCHPTSTSEIDKHQGGLDAYVDELARVVEMDRGVGGSKRIISIGEIGLDYDRLHFTPKEVQLKYFPPLLQLARRFHLPLFLHSRHPDAHVDFVRILREAGWDDNCPGGVVHSFTGTREEADELVEMGLYIGINGCSLKTEENLEVVKHLPLDRIMLETDAPWCSITTSHASHAHLPPADSPLLLSKVNKPDKWKDGQGVKGRMEPCEVGVIAHVVASVKGVPVEEVAEAAWANTLKLFYPAESAS